MYPPAIGTCAAISCQKKYIFFLKKMWYVTLFLKFKEIFTCQSECWKKKFKLEVTETDEPIEKKGQG
jgi:hypothetical protein